MGALWLIGFLAISIIAFFTCLFSLGSCVAFLRVPILMDYVAFSGLIPFVFLVSFGVTAFVIALVVLPLYSLFLCSARRFCRKHTLTLAIKSLKVALASTVAYFTCLILSALHVVPIVAMLVGFIALLVIVSRTARELLTAGFRHFITTIYIRLLSDNTLDVESKVTPHPTEPQSAQETSIKMRESKDETLEASSLPEATETQTVKIGKILDLVSNTNTGDAILGTSDFVGNIGVFGKEAGLTSCLIAVSAAHAGFNYVVLDYHGLYRTIIYSFPNGRVLRFGFDFTLDPFETEGMEASDYLELLFTAFHQAYRIPYSLLQPFLEVTLPVYEQAENRRITAAEIVGHINELIESPHHKAHQHELVNLREMLGHLLYGRTLEAVSAPPSLPISKFLQGLTVVELNRFTSHEFRNFIQALFLIKTFANLVTTKNRAEHTVILVDAIEHLFPDRNVLPLFSRELHLQYRLEELRKLGVNLHLSTAFPLEVDPFIVKWTRTKIFHEAFGRDPSFFSLNEVQRTFTARMQPPEALLSKWNGDMVPIVVDRPQWIFKAQPTDEEVEACLLRSGYPIREIQEEMEAKVSKDDLELDFGEDASSAYTLLKDLRDYENVTKLALVLTLANLPAEKARPLASLLERLGYMKEEKHHGGMPVLRLTMRGLKAVKQWEAKHPSLDNLPQPERVGKEEGKEESKDE